METKKSILFATLFLMFVLASGCSGFTGGKDKPPVSAQFVATGTEGIVMQFLADQPPAKVYTESPLTFLVEVRNKGTYTVQDVGLYLTGFDPNIIRMSSGFQPSTPITLPLEGKSQINPEGGYTTAEFSAQTVTLPRDMPNYKPTFLLTACYRYQTVATPLVCIDPNPMVQTADKACQVQKVYSTGSQGAPVAVKSIESEARPGGMYFRIHVGNTGGASGTLFSQNALGSCPAGLGYKDLNILQYAVELSGQPLSCEPKNELRLVNNAGVLFCKYNNLQQIPAYQTPLKVTLSYAYKNSISRQVEIENLNFGR